MSASSLDEALEHIQRAVRAREPVSVGLLGNICEVLPQLQQRGVRPDALTDQTSAHDPVNGYLPAGWTLEQWDRQRVADPQAVAHAAPTVPWRVTSRRCLNSNRRAWRFSTMATTSARSRSRAGVTQAFAFPGFVPAYIRPLFCRGVGPFRWAALSGDPEDIYRTDAVVKELIPNDPHLHNWLDMARERIRFQGLPARICWVGLGDRHRLGLAFNDMVARGELKAPVVYRSRSYWIPAPSPAPTAKLNRWRDGSDAVSDWPLLNALLNTASGATWVSIHHGGGVGMGFSQHAGVVIVCDGTAAAARRIERVFVERSGHRRHASCRCRLRGRADCARERGTAAADDAAMLTLTAETVSLEQLRAVLRAPLPIELGAAAREKVEASRALIGRIVNQDGAVYGVNTGFGLRWRRPAYRRAPGGAATQSGALACGRHRTAAR